MKIHLSYGCDYAIAVMLRNMSMASPDSFPHGHWVLVTSVGRQMGVSQDRGYLLGAAHHQDYSNFGVFIGPPIYGNQITTTALVNVSKLDEKCLSVMPARL